MANKPQAGKYAYDQSRVIDAEQYDFYALIMAAMRRADSENLFRLQQAWPSIYEELQQRYNAPAGWLQGDPHSPFGDRDPSQLSTAELIDVLGPGR